MNEVVLLSSLLLALHCPLQILYNDSTTVYNKIRIVPFKLFVDAQAVHYGKKIEYKKQSSHTQTRKHPYGHTFLQMLPLFHAWSKGMYILFKLQKYQIRMVN